MTAAEYLDALAPEFSADARAAVFLELAEARLSAATFGASLDHAIALLAAHMLTRAKADADASAAAAETPGTVTGRTAGDLSETYDAGPGGAGGGASLTDADLATTRYGLSFLALRNTRARARAGVVRP